MSNSPVLNADGFDYKRLRCIQSWPPAARWVCIQMHRPIQTLFVKMKTAYLPMMMSALGAQLSEADLAPGPPSC